MTFAENREALHRIARGGRLPRPRARRPATRSRSRSRPGGFGTPPVPRRRTRSASRARSSCAAPRTARRRASRSHVDPAAHRAPRAATSPSSGRARRRSRARGGRAVGDRISGREHFDIAFEDREVTYGGSPGDENHEEPYLYVAPWTAPEPAPEWNAVGFNGAEAPWTDEARRARRSSATAETRCVEPRRRRLPGLRRARGARPLGAVRGAGRGVAEDRELRRWLDGLPTGKRQPNLLFTAYRAARGHAERLGGVPRRARRAPRGGRGGHARAPHADQRAGPLRAAAAAARRAPAAARAARGRRERRPVPAARPLRATTTTATGSATAQRRCCAAAPEGDVPLPNALPEVVVARRARPRTRSTSPTPTRCAGSSC